VFWLLAAIQVFLNGNNNNNNKPESEFEIVSDKNVLAHAKLTPVL